MDGPNGTVSPSPPPTPQPSVTFEPPLYLQRRRAVHELLRQLSASNLFGGKKFKSVLDVGCGIDLLLLHSLSPCEDDLPLEHITGIDLDDGLFSMDLIQSIAPDCNEEENRWRELTVRLLHGSFEQLSPEVIPRHDAIVSTEVIEHLDPEPLANYAPVLLGKMRPKVCIVTTPNRDFNKIFDSALPHDPTRRYFRPEIPYAMRHHDHRFEWTRDEFRTWAKEAAAKWGYRVVFAGVGSLDCGAVCDDPLVHDFVSKNTEEFMEEYEDCYYSVTVSGQSMLGQGLQDLLGDPVLSATPGYLRHASRVLGPCSQIAIFMLCEPEPCTLWDEAVIPEHWNALPRNDLKLVCQHAYPWSKNEIYPPPYLKMLELMQETFPSFMPDLVAVAWDRIGKPFSRPDTRYEEYGDYDDYDDYEPPSAEVLEERRLARKEARHKEKERMKELERDMTGMNPDDVDVVRVVIEPLEVWKRSWALQRAFRFHFEVFEKMIMCTGEEVSVEISTQNNGDVVSEDIDFGSKWKTIHKAPTTTLQLYKPSPLDNTASKLVKLTIHDPRRTPPNIPGTPSFPEVTWPPEVISPVEAVSPSEEGSPPEEEPLFEAFNPDDVFLPEVTSQNSGALTNTFAEGSSFDTLPVTGGSIYTEPANDNPLRLHTVAVWPLDSVEIDDSSMEVEVDDETRMLQVPRKEVLCQCNGKIVLTYFKPEEERDPWGIFQGYNEQEELEPDYDEESFGWVEEEEPPFNNGRSNGGENGYEYDDLSWDSNGLYNSPDVWC